MVIVEIVCQIVLLIIISLGTRYINVSCNGDELTPKIKQILKIKYNLKIIKINPLKLKK